MWLRGLRNRAAETALKIAMAPIDPQISSALGFPKTKYMAVERERRWTAFEVPRDRVIHTETITDLYVAGTRLRLREARRTDTGEAIFKLTRKADVNPQTRFITSIYLPEQEFAVLAAALDGVRISKLRHRLHSPPGIALCVDEFKGEIAGLRIAEAEFDSDDLMRDFTMPDFASREVTDDVRFTGPYLATYGRPVETG